MKKIINIGLWKQPIYLLWSSNPEKYNKFLKSIGEEEDDMESYYIGRTNYLDSGCIVIYVKEINDKQRMLLTLNHEIFHATKFSLDARGVSFDEEVYAYTMEQIQKKCYKAIGLDVKKSLN